MNPNKLTARLTAGIHVQVTRAGLIRINGHRVTAAELASIVDVLALAGRIADEKTNPA